MTKLQSLPTNPFPRRDIVESEELIGKQLFLYDENIGDVHCLNSGAAIIWLLCDGKRGLVSIAKAISSAYGLAESQVLPEVQGAVAQFQSLNLLESPEAES